MRASTHKHRDIARSILPSRHRASARHDLAEAKRRHRRLIRADLRALTAEVAHDADRALDATIDLRRTADAEVNAIRRARRAADKLNHFERWAVRATREIPVEDRRSHLRAILPDGLIGEHAMSHLDHLPDISPRVEGQWRCWSTWDPDAPRRRAVEGRARLAAALRVALHQPDGHRAINLALRAIEAYDAPPGRRLLGAHDVDAFVDALWPNPDDARLRWGRIVGPTAEHEVVVTVLDEVVAGWR